MSKAQQYEKAKELRKRGLLGNITENLIEGRGSIAGGIGRGVSQTLGAKVTGIKEAFDPLNLARKMAGGLGVGLIGRATGRSKEDMSHFLGKTPAKTQAPSASKVGNVSTALYANVSDGSRSKLNKNERLANVGAKLYIALKTSYEINKLEKELARNFSKEIEREDQRRHEELIKSIGKPQKPEQKKVETRKVEKAIGKPTTPAPSKAPAPVPASTPSKAPAPAPTPSKAPTPAPAPTATPQKKVAAIEKPKAEPVKVEPTKAPEKKVAAIEKPKPPEAKMETPKAEPAKVPEKKVAAIEKPKTAEVKTEPAKVPEKKVASIEKPKEAPTAKPSATKQIATIAAVTSATLAGKEAIAANISKYESGKAGYNAYNKGTVGNKMIGSDVPIDFSKMTISEFLQRGKLKSGDPNRLFAIGKYQIIPNTMEGLVKKLKLDPNTTYLDADTQDKLFANGLVGSVRRKVDAYVKGTSSDRDAAILELAQEFASVGIPYDMTIKGKTLKRGESYYSGQGGNKAHNSPDEVGNALDIDRNKNLKSTSTAVDITPPTGTKLNQSSIENADAKKQSKGQTTVIQDNSTKIVSAGAKQPGVLKETPRDLPLHQQ